MSNRLQILHKTKDKVENIWSNAEVFAIDRFLKTQPLFSPEKQAVQIVLFYDDFKVSS